MKRFLAIMGLTLTLLFGVTAPAANAASLYQCQYKYYPYSTLWTTNVNWVIHLTSTKAWFCVKWL